MNTSSVMFVQVKFVIMLLTPYTTVKEITVILQKL